MPLELETLSQRVRGLVHGLRALDGRASGLSRVGLHESPQTALGLGAREAVLLPRVRTLPIFLLTKRPS